jgi:3',5'-cyclic AMP phosphodiesterase CpdA
MGAGVVGRGMSQDCDRRDFLALLGIGGLVFSAGLPGCGSAAGDSVALAPRTQRRVEDFFFLQLTDTHWGFHGSANPQADTTLERAVATINSVDARPDFVVFTGDLTHVTGDGAERHERMKRFRDIVSRLAVKDLRFLPGEHDAAPDRGEAYREQFGDPTYAFDHKGVHFVALDNASMPGGAIGAAQVAWLEADLARIPADAPVVVLAHRPLFPLFPAWEWQTADGASALEVLSRRENVTVFYGHIHQEHHFTTGRVVHHASRSLVFPLPAPGSVPEKGPLPWDAASPDHGLGWRQVALAAGAPRLTELPYR